MDHAPPALSARLIEALHTETMLLADEMGGYFDGPGRIEREALAPRARVLFACESLKATTRLMQLLAWLSLSRSHGGGAAELDRTIDSADEVLGQLPTGARRLVLAGIELHGRARRLADGQGGAVATISPARGLLDRLERAF